MRKAKICQVKGDITQAEKLINKALVAIENSGNPAAFVKLQQEAKAWYRKRNINQKGVDWQFTTEKARIKLKRLYPQIQML